MIILTEAKKIKEGGIPQGIVYTNQDVLDDIGRAGIYYYRMTSPRIRDEIEGVLKGRLTLAGGYLSIMGAGARLDVPVAQAKVVKCPASDFGTRADWYVFKTWFLQLAPMFLNRRLNF